jgi:hypothetical protein
MRKGLLAVLFFVALGCSGSSASPPAKGNDNGSIAPPAGLTYSSNPAVYTVGTAITGNVPTSSGGAIASYSVSPGLPSGLRLDATTGVITGAPAALCAGTVYIVTAKNAGGSASASVWIAVNDIAPSGLSYSNNPANYTVGTAIAPNVPSSIGGAVVSYSVSPGLPSGLTLNTATGVLSGTPMALADSVYTVTAINSGGSTPAYVRIRTNPPPAPAILGQPSGRAVSPGQTSAFSVVASGTGTLNYQWRKNGTPIPGATSASYITPPVAFADDGSNFSVDVADAFGGNASSGVATLFVQEFDPTGPLITARYDHTATLLATGKVLIAGGNNGNGATSNAEVYDPATGQFTSQAGGYPYPAPLSMVQSRERHTATLLPSGKVLLTGGHSALGGYADPAEVYDPASGTFSATGALGTMRQGHTATLLQSGRVLVVGGLIPWTGLKDVQLYDPGTGQFSYTGSTVACRTFHTAILLPDGRVLVAGGDDLESTTTHLASAEVYDPVSGTFSLTGFMSVTRTNHTATLLQNGMVLIAGGYGPSGEALASAELYDPATGTFSPTGPMSAGRYGHTATLLSNGKVLVVGGAAGLTSAEVYDPVSGTFMPAVPMITCHPWHTSTLLPSGKVLVVGGTTPWGLLPNAELWSSGP